MATPYNSQLDAFSLYHQIQESQESEVAILGGPALPALGHAVAGAIGSAISNVCVYPLELIITRLQVQRQLRKDPSIKSEEEYKNLRDAVQKIYREGGLSAFFAGIVPDTGKSVADAFLFFLAYNFIRENRLRSVNGLSGKKTLPALDELSVGFLAGALSRFCTTPLANIVTRQQTASMARDKGPLGSRQAPSIKQTASEIKAEKGLRGFWSGYSASLVLTLNPSITFFLYEFFKRFLLPRSQRDRPTATTTFLLAAVSKAVASVITYPFSLAKARAQVSTRARDEKDSDVKEGFEEVSGGRISGTESARKAARSTVFGTILTIARHEGVGSLYEGIEGEVIKGFFAHGITMLVKETVHRMVIRLYYAILRALQKYPSPEQLAQQATDSARTVIITTKERVQSVYVSGSQQVGDALEKSKESAQATIEAGKQQAENVYETSKGKVWEAYDGTSKGVSELYEKGREGKEWAVDKSNETSDYIADYVGEKTEEMGEALKSQGSSLKKEGGEGENE